MPLLKRSSRVVVAAVALATVVAGCAGTTDGPGPNSASGPATSDPSPTPTLSAKDAYIAELMAGMSLSDKAATVLMLNAPGTDFDALVDWATSRPLGGLILMGSNVPSDQSALKPFTDDYSDAAQAGPVPLVPLIAIDEEGGEVTRLPLDTLPGANQLRTEPPSATKKAFRQRGEMLNGLGINTNFGIVADFTADPGSFIFGRSLGDTPDSAAERVAAAVEGSEGLDLSTLKHFPGHGSAPGDSHFGVPQSPLTKAQWGAADALPFEAGIDAGADLVMMGHLRFPEVDQRPASVSPTWYGILRKDLGFEGLAITDDLSMLLDSGEPEFADPVANVVAALGAGADVALLTFVYLPDGVSSQPDPAVITKGIVQAVRDGELSRSDLDDRVEAVLGARYDLTFGAE